MLKKGSQYCILFAALVMLSAWAKGSVLIVDTIQQLPDQRQYVNQIDKKYKKLNDQLTAVNQQLLAKLQKQEDKIKKKLLKVDSLKAKQLMGNSTEFYLAVQNKLNTKANKLAGINQYIPRLDSLQVLGKFLSSKATSSIQQQQIQTVTNNILQTQNQLQASDEIRKMLSERKQSLQQLLNTSALKKEWRKLNKEIFYYQEQIKEYRTLLNDGTAWENKAIDLLRKQPLFKSFMQKNSWLAQLYPTPATIGTLQALEGMQTREQLQQIIAQQTGGMTNAGNFLQQQSQQGKALLNELKDKAMQTLGGDGTEEVPEFKPNSQRTKQFWKRLEYGLNIQSQRTHYLLPVTTDIAFLVGYKLNDKSSAGVGVSYKLGWGESIKNIRLTNQGIGLRTYIDVKLKGSIWLSGGYEQNYMPTIPSAILPVNVEASQWQQSGLIGISKKYRIGKKTYSTQLLYNLLQNSNLQKSNQIYFRIGWSK